MSGGDCPRGGKHNWRFKGETAGMITHECSKCHEEITREREPSRADGAGWGAE